jgi:hypothetical protein
VHKGVARLEEWLEELDVEPYVLAPIVSDEKWAAYEQTLETFGEPQGTRIEPTLGVEGGYFDNTHPLPRRRSSYMVAKL